MRVVQQLVKRCSCDMSVSVRDIWSTVGVGGYLMYGAIAANTNTLLFIELEC